MKAALVRPRDLDRLLAKVLVMPEARARQEARHERHYQEHHRRSRSRPALEDRPE